ncbi:TIR domain-containing protein [Vacuolonema iberomarrocanum]|uniref:TIR domain-containing protein n=1 Tax=Vacuolonema iberomarrocanum TaxID=3454632 RepID=UPI001A0DBDBF|nr:toll/interleukin-1 receptor domain-containing protein [filamentous cyanobacterium LEGE 07170]
MKKTVVATGKLSLFISYVQKDEVYLDELEIHLKTLVRQNLIASWSRKNLLPGAEAKAETIQKLEESDIILLMISPDLIASDDFWLEEMPIALRRHQTLVSFVIPVLLRRVDWENTPIAQLQVLPRNEIPVQKWPERDEAYARIVVEIREVIEEIDRRCLRRKEYRDFLEESLGKQYTISGELRIILQEFAKKISLHPQEVYLVETDVLSRKRIEAEKRIENLAIYEVFFRDKLMVIDSPSILRTILNKKLSELFLEPSDSDVLQIERDAKKELMPSLFDKVNFFFRPSSLLNFVLSSKRNFLVSAMVMFLLLTLIGLGVKSCFNEAIKNFQGNDVSSNRRAPHKNEEGNTEIGSESRDSKAVENDTGTPVEFIELYFERVEYGLYEEAFQMLSQQYIDEVYLSKDFTLESAFADYKSFWDRCDIQYRDMYQESELANNEVTVFYQSRLFCSDDDQIERDHSFELRRMVLVKSHIDGEWRIRSVTSTQ